jgi:hypothetical protein
MLDKFLDGIDKSISIDVRKLIFADHDNELGKSTVREAAINDKVDQHYLINCS